MKIREKKSFNSIIRKLTIVLVLFVSLNIGVRAGYAVPVMTASKVDSLIVDVDGDTFVDLGDTIRYAITLEQSGTTNAESAVFSDTIDSNTTLVPGSLRTTPIARHDQYASLGNVGISVPSASGVLVNDNDPDGQSISVIAVAAGSTANGGAFSIEADGAFTYLPPAGFEGTDSFTYNVQDSDVNLDPATVFITVNEVIWFIDNSQAGPGSGVLTNPFNSIANFNNTAADEAGDIIFFYSGSGSYTSGIVLLNNQYLIGQGATASIASISGIALPPHSNALPATGGARPVITTASGDGVVVGQNNTLRGFNIGNTVGVGISDNGGTVGTLTASEVGISGTGGGIEADNGGTLAVTLDSLSASSSSDEAVDLENVGGSFAVTAANGTLNMTGVPAVVIDGNPSLNINTLTFQSVSSANAAHGISIRDTTGSFSVTGTGTTAGSGGTLSGHTAEGVFLNNASNISLSNMIVNQSATSNTQGLDATNVSGLSLIGTTITAGSGNSYALLGSSITNMTATSSVFDGGGGSVPNIDGVRITNLFGTNTFTNSTFQNGKDINLLIENDTNGGTLNTLSILGSSFSNSAGGDHLQIEADGTANLKLVVNASAAGNTSFSGTGDDGIQLEAGGNATFQAVITGATFTNTFGSTINLGAVANGHMIARVYNLSGLTSTSTNVINMISFDTSHIEATIENNTISGTAGNGIRVIQEGNGTVTANLAGNTITGITQGNGILVQGRAGTGGNGLINATINNNYIRTTTALAAENGIEVTSGSSLGGDTNTICLNMLNNDSAGNAFSGYYGYFLRHRTGSTFRLQDFAGPATSAAITTWVNTTKNNTGSVFVIDAAGFTSAPANCATPTVPTASIPSSGTLAQNHGLHSDQSQAAARFSETTVSLGTQITRNLRSAFSNLFEGIGDVASAFVERSQIRTAHASGEPVTVNLGNLDPGQIVTITFDVTIDAVQTPATNAQVCNQGSVSGSNFANIFTDDPDVGGSADPTCTQLAPGTIVIAKDETPDGNTAFGFSSDIPGNAAFNVSGDSSVTIHNVAPGSYTVTEDDPTASFFALIGLSCDDGTSAAASTTDLGTRTATIYVESGETVTCTFTNELLTFSLGDRVWYDQDHDGLQDPNEPGYDGVTVDLYDNSTCSGTPIASTTTGTSGPAGSYEFLDLLAGDYCLQFYNIPASWIISSEDQGGDDTIDSDANGSGQIPNINLGSDTADLDMGVFIAGSLGGRVTCTSNGSGLSPITVILYQDFDGDGIADSFAIATTQTDALGFYQFTGLEVALAGDSNNTTRYVVGVDTNDPDLGLCSVLLPPTQHNPLLNSDNPSVPDNDFSFEFLNQAPVAHDDSYFTTEDTTLTVDAGGSVLANDTDSDGDALTTILDTTTVNGSLTLNSDGSFSYTPDINYCGPDNFTYHANDGQADSNVATVSITVECVDDLPVVSVDISTQDVQYSDYIGDVTVTATDVDSHPLNISDDAFSNLSTIGSCTAAGNGTSCSWTLSGQVLVSAGTRTVTFTVSDETSNVTASTEVVVLAENAKVTFDGNNPVAVPVSSPGGTSEPFTLTVYVQEAAESGADTAPGDINLASVSLMLEPIGPGSPTTVACVSTGSVAQFNYSAVLTLECDFSGVEVNAYSAAAVVAGGYYTGSSEDSLVVYDPSLGFTTGGGWFYWPGTNDRTTFGYTMKYNKKATNIQGNLILIRHLSDGSIYRLKSNAVDGLALGEESGFGWAAFSGKATYQAPSWLEPEGNYTFTVYVEDHGDPGSSDRMWVEVRDKDGVVVGALSINPDGSTNAVTLGGGNIVVPHKTEEKGKNK